MLILTLIRHGESTDNVKSVWAGVKDAELTNHGMNQAKALAKWFRDHDTRFNAILSSTLARADTTARAIHDAQPSPKPSITKNPIIREQSFGIAEGHPYNRQRPEGLSLEECYAQDIFPHPRSRIDRFPGGESREDVARRAERFVNEMLVPQIGETLTSDVHTAIVSHGLFIRELVGALLKLDNIGTERFPEAKGLRNTAWTRITVEVLDETAQGSDTVYHIRVRITDVNRHEHLNSVIRQKGGIGNALLRNDPPAVDVELGLKRREVVDLKVTAFHSSRDENHTLVRGYSRKKDHLALSTMRTELARVVEKLSIEV